MTESYQRILSPAAGFASAEIGSFLAQLDDQNRRLAEDTRGISPAELQWQPEPGTNTIGMLLAHIAIVEGHWLSVAAQAPFECEKVIGIGVDDDGMPIPAGGLPPATLANRDLAYFDDLLARARAHTRSLTRRWTDAELDRRVQRTRKDGNTWTFNVRWVLYHVLEHEAGHYGQILLLRHLHRDTTPAVARL